ncbi:hypothetical protein dsx2_2613 [Desulfovibrio sp. X2]|uniref:hypothetical protein n=1 Tax=Desulfovibrio sp. X2 TaxID=941449 RepID=UPI000358CC2C|nr:hypothetical protein [Desulfovibrio sp. X2]EPR42696.1 hypothetical protein dsx2_2613 [Desulfovibrio sp. X2]
MKIDGLGYALLGAAAFWFWLAARAATPWAVVPAILGLGLAAVAVARAREEAKIFRAIKDRRRAMRQTGTPVPSSNALRDFADEAWPVIVFYMALIVSGIFITELFIRTGITSSRMSSLEILIVCAISVYVSILAAMRADRILAFLRNISARIAGRK